ncbi:Protein TIFY 10B [Ananas comosus]|uniref:Protein TIFY n=1 Tax=Ananas comosus TaxID=4615 RepID=A0A199V007_ANACO|nr:Protein TIFY 10B [Ananas comosus]
MERNMNMVMEERREKTTKFSLTCSLLSQYMKEKKSFGGLDFEMALDQGPKGVFRPPITMNLMPGIDLNAPESTEVHFPEFTSHTVDVSYKGQNVNKEGTNEQLTIFYGGEVLVFDNISGEKYEELIEMAKKGRVSAENFGFATGGGHVAVAQSTLPSTIQTTASDMPIARRNSLHRFLQKRKHRINSKAPYQTNVVKPEEDNKSWLTFKL